MVERTRGYAHRIDVEAPVEWLWRGLVEPGLLRLWFGTDARVDPRRGGSYRVRAARDLEREAHIDVFEPGRRLRLIYLPPRDLPSCDAVIVDDFIFSVEQDNAVLRLLGSGFPQEEAWDAYYQRLRVGWVQALLRLKVCIEHQLRRASAPPAPSAPPMTGAGNAAAARGPALPRQPEGENGRVDSWELLP